MTANQHQEYGSVILTVDHTTAIVPHAVQKLVFSTESLNEAAIAVIKYYGEEAILASADTIEQFQALAQSKYPCLVYRTPENVEIILSLDTYNALIARSETLLDANTFILDTVGEIIVTSEQAAGAPIPLFALAWDEGEVAPAPAKPQRSRKGAATPRKAK